MKKSTKIFSTVLSIVSLILGSTFLGIYSSSSTSLTNDTNNQKQIKPNKPNSPQPAPKKPSPQTKDDTTSHKGKINNNKNNNNLSITTLKNYVETLQLSKYDKLSDLTNDQLQQKLKNHHPNLTVTIETGSDESTGTLILKFTGKDGDQTISETSVITGFETYDGDNFSLQNIQINFDNWFDKQLPIEKSTKEKIDVSKINKDKLLTNLISSANITIWKNNSEINSIPIKEGMKFLKELSVESINETSNNSYSLKLRPVQLNFKRFDGTNWEDSKVRTLKADSFKDNIFPIPTLLDLEDRILEQTNVKTSTSFTNYYPSYFESKWEAAKAMSLKGKGQPYDVGLKDFTNYSEIENKYHSYLDQAPKTTLRFEVDTEKNALTADDYQGTLSFKMQLKNENSNSDTIQTNKEFHLSGMKKISNFIADKTKETNEFKIVKDTGFFFYKKVLAIMKEDFQFSAFLYLTNLVSKVISINAEKLKDVLEFVNNDGYVFNAQDNEETAKSRINKLMDWNDILYLFNKTLSVNNHDYVNSYIAKCSLYNKNYFGADKYKDVVGPEVPKNLYKCLNDDKSDDYENALIINSIKYTFDQTKDKIEFTLTRNSSNKRSMNVAFNGKAIVGFGNKKQNEEFKTKFIVDNLTLTNFTNWRRS